MSLPFFLPGGNLLTSAVTAEVHKTPLTALRPLALGHSGGPRWPGP